MQLSIRKAMDRLWEDRKRHARLYRHLQESLWRHAAGRVPHVDQHMVSQACDEAMIEIGVKYRGDFTAPVENVEAFDDALAKYLFKAAKNRLTSSRRSDPRGREVPLDDGIKTIGKYEVAGSLWEPTLQDSPTAAVLAEQRAALLRECLGNLTRLARLTFELALRGFNDREIQSQLQVASASTVRRRIHDTKQKMMECVRRKTTDRHAHE